MSKDEIWVTFGAYVSYGKMDANNYDVDVPLSKEEYKRLKRSRRNNWRMSDDNDIADIYQKAYKAALDMDIEELRRDPERLNEQMAYYFDQYGIERDEEENGGKTEYTDEEIKEMLESDGSRGITYPSGFEDDDDINEELSDMLKDELCGKTFVNWKDKSNHSEHFHFCLYGTDDPVSMNVLFSKDGTIRDITDASLNSEDLNLDPDELNEICEEVLEKLNDILNKDYSVLVMRYYASFGRGDSSDVITRDIYLNKEEQKAFRRACSQETKLETFEELKKVIREAYEEACDIETSNLCDIGDEYCLELLGRKPIDKDDLVQLVRSRDPKAIECLELEGLSDEELANWTADGLDEMPDICDVDSSFTPKNPFEQGYSLRYYFSEEEEWDDDDEY